MKFRWPSWLEPASLPPSSSFVYWDTYLIRLFYQLFLLCVLLTLNDFLFFFHSFDARLNIIRPYCKTHWWALTYFTSDDPDSIKKCALILIYNKRELHILSLVPLSKHSGWLQYLQYYSYVEVITLRRTSQFISNDSYLLLIHSVQLQSAIIFQKWYQKCYLHTFSPVIIVHPIFCSPIISVYILLFM